VVPLVFKTSERRAASLAGSIPVRLRYPHVRASPSRVLRSGLRALELTERTAGIGPARVQAKVITARSMIALRRGRS
jgi:hypothetical protein